MCFIGILIFYILPLCWRITCTVRSRSDYWGDGVNLHVIQLCMVERTSIHNWIK